MNVRIGIVQTYEPGEREAYPLGACLEKLGADWVAIEARYLKAVVDNWGTASIIFEGDPQISDRGLDQLALDGIVWRVSEADYYTYGNIYDLLAKNYLMINNWRCTWICSDKWRTGVHLAAAGIPVVPTVLLTPDMPVPVFPDHKTVVKPSIGASGNGVRLVPPGTVLGLSEPHVAQPLIAGPSSAHVRVIVCGSSPVVSIHRIPGPEHAGREIEINNIAAGGTPVAAPMQSVGDLSVRVAESVGSDIIGIDFVPWNDGFAVLEVNSSPGFSGIAEALGVDCFMSAAKQVLRRLDSAARADGHQLLEAGSVGL